MENYIESEKYCKEAQNLCEKIKGKESLLWIEITI